MHTTRPIRSGPTLWFFGLAALLCAPIIGLVPTRATVIALAVGVGFVGLADQVRRAEGLDGLVPRMLDGRLAPVAYAALTIPGGLAIATGLTVGIGSAQWRPAVEAACLCASRAGLYATVGNTLGVACLAFVLCFSLLSSLIGVALVRAHLRG